VQLLEQEPKGNATPRPHKPRCALLPKLSMSRALFPRARCTYRLGSKSFQSQYGVSKPICAASARPLKSGQGSKRLNGHPSTSSVSIVSVYGTIKCG
jgi:hypothetical protein